jgi:hypothetical protein
MVDRALFSDIFAILCFFSVAGGCNKPNRRSRFQEALERDSDNC